MGAARYSLTALAALTLGAAIANIWADLRFSFGYGAINVWNGSLAIDCITSGPGALSWGPGSMPVSSGRRYWHSRPWTTRFEVGFDTVSSGIEVVIPLWLVFVPCSAGGVVLWRVRRYSSGRCRTCGYDLRATPDRCPECGKLSKRAESRLPTV